MDERPKDELPTLDELKRRGDDLHFRVWRNIDELYALGVRNGVDPKPKASRWRKIDDK